MQTEPGTSRITCRADLDAQFDALVARDPALVPIRAKVGEVPLRLIEPGFGALTWIICGQLLSVAAARAIHQRVLAHFGDVTGAALLNADDELLYGLGLSRAKIKSLKALAVAEQDGTLDLTRLHALPASQAHKNLTVHKGIGPWTADLYLLSAAGHADIFPAGDLALRKMVGTMGRFEALPSIAQTADHAQRWSPQRSAAARLLWALFAHDKNKQGIDL